MKMMTVKSIDLPQGRIRYREAGTGDPIVFVHGLLVDGELWRDVAAPLEADFRVIVPDWPLGSQQEPAAPGTDLSPPGLARIVADFLEAMELDRVTLVGNDTGGAICQIVATRHPGRLARLVLTPCDAYEHFPPPAFKALATLGRSTAFLAGIGQSMRIRAMRRSPLAYGWLMREFDDERCRAWVEPVRRDRVIRGQVAQILAGFDPEHTLAAAARFGELEMPVLIMWAPEDRFFKLADAERMAREIPNARLERVENSYTFVPVDQPARTAELIAAFAREPVAAA
jgi:pimeloyl-ACP methyl ester carboxylesterase